MLGTLALTAAIASAVGTGCSSSSDDGGNTGNNDAGSTGNDATADTGSSTGDDAEVCSVDASLTAFAASDASGSQCAACFDSMCHDAIQACANDCTCIKIFSCIADAGTLDINSLATVGLSCAAGDITALVSNSALMGLTTCATSTCKNACGTLVAPPDSGSTDAGTTTTDAATTTTDAGDGG